jgi:prophage regulatory protein
MATSSEYPAAVPHLLRLPAVRAKVGLCRSSIYDRVAKGTFPKPINLGSRAVAWASTDVDRWISERIEASKQGEA